MPKAGLLASPGRGRFVATDAGRALLSQRPVRVDVDRLLDYPVFRAFYKGGNGAIESRSEVAYTPPAPKPDGGTPEEQIETAYQTVRSALRMEPQIGRASCRERVCQYE